MRYRMRPVEKDAWAIRDVIGHGADGHGPLDPRVRRALEDGTVVPYEEGCVIHTAEGVMTGGVDDYLVLGLQGEWYPVMRAVFEKTYEPVEVSS